MYFYRKLAHRRQVGKNKSDRDGKKVVKRKVYPSQLRLSLANEYSSNWIRTSVIDVTFILVSILIDMLKMGEYILKYIESKVE